ncbi:DHH family phosphoesterase [Flexistipes sp.]|uniref:DHH family phosphoesterase n=1 Tax=Flexistipes sp. TaxID=3088135 RepID=UPI002E1C507B|nr:bifunctional oligoribonuclease/PAP phosphatase NrnA [Flexistipes sp.]
MINKILEYIKPKRKILILMHNNPDPDTIASAFALKTLFSALQKKRCTLAYHGLIGRAENRELVKLCKIDMHLSAKLNFARYDCLVLVDTQPTAGNVFIQKKISPDIVIDHHNLRSHTKKVELHDIRKNYGSTSTIITEYYKQLNITPDTNTATALFYGIKTDTLGSGRSNSKVDTEMMGYILPGISLNKLAKIENPELPKYYFKNMKKATENAVVINDLIFCNLSDVRNADLIAETSDFFLRMRDIKWTFVIGKINNICYFSLRCKSTKRKVGHIALGLVRGIGTGGGHMKSAGGQIPLKEYNYDEIVTKVKERLLTKIFGSSDIDQKRL